MIVRSFRTLSFAAALCAAVTPGVAWAQGAAVNEATKEQKGEAQTKYLDARKAYDERRFADALQGFRASFDVVASPNTHLMIGHSLRELGRNAEAYEAFRKSAEEARHASSIDPKYAATVDLAAEEQKLLEPQVALVTVAAAQTPGAKLKIAGRDVPTARWGQPFAVDPGEVSIVYQGAGEPVARTIQVEAGATEQVDLSPAQVDDGTGQETEDGGGFSFQWTGTQRYIAYGVAGLGVGALIGSAVTGSLAQGKFSDLEDACGDLPCPDRQDDIDSGKTLMTTTNVLVGVGGALLLGGVVLYFTAPDEEEEAPSDDFAITEVRVGPGSLMLEGTF